MSTGFRRVASFCVAALLVGALSPTPHGVAEEDPTWPGLPKIPDIPYDEGGALWLGLSISGAQEISRAKQWFQIPKTIIAAQSIVRSPSTTETNQENYAFVVSPEGAPHPYGHFAPIQVRTVAFGMIPVTFTVHLSQPRDAEDLPIPLASKTNAEILPANLFRFADSTVAGELEARVTDMEVDGVPVPIGENCRTAENVEVELHGTGYTSENPPNPAHPEPGTTGWLTTKFYTATNGGRLVGNSAMPEFVGCQSGGEDFSALITGMSSSPQNETIQRQSGVMTCWGWYQFDPCIDHEVPLPTRP